MSLVRRAPSSERYARECATPAGGRRRSMGKEAACAAQHVYRVMTENHTSSERVYAPSARWWEGIRSLWRRCGGVH